MSGQKAQIKPLIAAGKAEEDANYLKGDTMSKQPRTTKNVMTQQTPTPSKKDISFPKFETDENGSLHIFPSCPEEVENLHMTLGTDNAETGQFLLAQLLGMLEGSDPSKGLEAMLQVLRSIAPSNELEGLLTIQMLGIHSLTAKNLRRAMSVKTPPEQMQMYTAQVVKLARTFTTQLEALNRHRGKGQQKMTVEHVNVNEGGKAVIGNVGQGGGGDENE